MRERDVTIDAFGNRLAGTLCLPAKGEVFPVVLMLHGTGPLDRDENMPGQRLDVFNTISHRLAERGFASVRYDKRGCGKSTGSYAAAGHSDLVADAVAWIDAVQAESYCAASQLYLLGHSEGCWIAPQASRQRRVAGLVLLCPAIEPIEAVLMRQAGQIENEIRALPGLRGHAYRFLAKLFGTPLSNQRKLIDKLKSTTARSFWVGLQKVQARSLRELLALDIRALFQGVDRPMLLIGGEKDLQCLPEDVAAIAALSTAAEAHVVPNLTHILRLDSRPASMLGYSDLLKEPLAPEVTELTARWLERQSRAAADREPSAGASQHRLL